MSADVFRAGLLVFLLGAFFNTTSTGLFAQIGFLLVLLGFGVGIGGLLNPDPRR